MRTADCRLRIDGRDVSVAEGTTILDAAARLGIRIPTLCYTPRSKPRESCFVCAVQVIGQDRLVPACSMPAAEGMDVVTDSPQVVETRRAAMELLLSDHLGECLAPCQLACPTAWDIPGFMEALATGDLSAAAETARAGLTLPTVLGHVCPAPCQKACRRNDRDATVAIRDLHRWVPAAAEVLAGPARRVSSDAVCVAVVGAGPAGLAAAHALALDGCAVTLVDAGETPGGSLLKVDLTKLPPAALTVDLAAIQAAGVVFRNGVRVGEDIALADLRRDFAAVILAVGQDPHPTAAGTEPVPLPEKASHTTAEPGVFLAGACRGTSGMVVRVIADGLAAAKSVRRFLAGDEPIEPSRLINVRYGPLEEEEQDILWARPTNNAPQPGPVTNEASAAREAGRCLVCGCADNQLCRLRCVATELGVRRNRHVGERRRLDRDASHPKVVYEPHKCILCGACVANADASDDASLTYVGRGFAARVSAPYEGRMADALGADGAAYAELCPTSAFHRKRRPEGNG